MPKYEMLYSVLTSSYGNAGQKFDEYKATHYNSQVATGTNSQKRLYKNFVYFLSSRYDVRMVLHCTVVIVIIVIGRSKTGHPVLVQLVREKKGKLYIFIKYQRQWRIQGAPLVPPTAQNFLDFMQFWGKFHKIVCWRPLEGRRPLLRGILDLPLKGAKKVVLNRVRKGTMAPDLLLPS